MMDVTAKRVAKEIKELAEASELSDQVWLEMQDDSLKRMNGFIRGPPDTPYAGGVFKLDIAIPDTYPFAPPAVMFTTKIWHPNISSKSGYICLDILAHEWSASLTLKGILLSLQALLQEPQPDDPQDAVVARQLRRSPVRFRKTANYWTCTFAMPGDTELPDELNEFEQKVIKMMDMRSITRDKAIAILSNNNWRLDPIKSSRPRRTRNAAPVLN